MGEGDRDAGCAAAAAARRLPRDPREHGRRRGAARAPAAGGHRGRGALKAASGEQQHLIRRSDSLFIHSAFSAE